MKKLVMAALALSVAAGVQAEGRDAAELYNKTCTACHSVGAAGAPKSFNADDWKPRLEKGMDTLVASVTNGLNAMPPKGMCMDCTADEYKALIQYMSTPK